jgi:hypothetical protein
MGVTVAVALAADAAGLPKAVIKATLRRTSSSVRDRQPIEIPFAPAVFNRQVCALNESLLLQSTMKSSQPVRDRIGGLDIG